MRDLRGNKAADCTHTIQSVVNLMLTRVKGSLAARVAAHLCILFDAGMLHFKGIQLIELLFANVFVDSKSLHMQRGICKWQILKAAGFHQNKKGQFCSICKIGYDKICELHEMKCWGVFIPFTFCCIKKLLHYF